MLPILATNYTYYPRLLTPPTPASMSSHSVTSQLARARFLSRYPLVALRKIYSSQKSNLIIAAILFIIKQSPQWMLPVATATILDLVTVKPGEHPHYLFGLSSEHYFLAVCIFYFVLIVQNAPIHALFIRYLSRAVRSVQMELRQSLVIKMQQLSLSFHDQSRRGALQSKILRDVDNIEMFSRQMYNTLLGSVVTMTAALVATLCTQPIVALYFLVAVPVSVVLIRAFHKTVQQTQSEFRREVEGMSAQVSEMIDRIPTTRAHGLETWEIGAMEQRLERIRTKGEKLDFTTELFASSSWVSFQVSQFICLLFTAWMVYKGKITVGQAMMYHGYFGMLVGSVGGILAIWPIFLTGAESMKSIGEVLEASDVETSDGKAPVPSVNGDFVFDHVTFQYPTQKEPAVLDLHVTVPSGQCIAVVGASGSGKSTLMNLIIGFLRPTSGRILLDGKDLMDLNMQEYRRSIAVVPQVTILFSGTLRENITYGLTHVDEAQLLRCVTMANLDEVVSQMPKGLETIIGERGATLSGGQRQRVAIARAMLRNPRVLILDEATSALDVFSEKVVQDALTRLLQGRTTFIVAHRLSTIRHANRILVMDHGKLVESGDHDSLLAANGVYARMNALHELAAATEG